MTENELIKTHIEECTERIGRILGYMETAEDANTKFCERNVEVLKSVIIALEEIQQYRAIGTIEEIKEKLSLLEKYEELGTVEELDEVLNMFC